MYRQTDWIFPKVPLQLVIMLLRTLCAVSRNLQALSNHAVLSGSNVRGQAVVVTLLRTKLLSLIAGLVGGEGDVERNSTTVV